MNRNRPELVPAGARHPEPPEFSEEDFNYNLRFYKLSGYVLSILQKLLKVNIALHAPPEQIAAGDIFLFNHFARFETFIPPYLIYKETKIMSRSVASPEFFRGNDGASKLLRGLGAIPADYPNLYSYLGTEIIRGRKVIVFPEGGMVKDRRVVDKRGHFSIYSRKAKERRKHHAGAAVIANGLEIFREAILRANKRGDDALLAKWAASIGEDGRERLIAFADRTIKVVPANITFYPIRVDTNLLEKWAEMVGGGSLEERFREELRIEGNILLKDTDMDIRLGPSASPGAEWSSVDRVALDFLLGQVTSMESAFELLRTGGGGALGEIIANRAKQLIYKMRDRYMRDIYAVVSVNLSQLASALVFKYIDENRTEVPEAEFYRTLYLAMKKLQPRAEVALHRSLVDPDLYHGVENGRCAGLSEFLGVAKELELIEARDFQVRFQEKLSREAQFDHIRVENPLAVYANEIRPLKAVDEAITQAMREERKLGAQKLAAMRFDDELMGYRFDKFRFSKPKYKEINDQQTLTADTRPYLLKPEVPRQTGVILIHGFSSSPGELRPLGEYLHNLGYAVLGVRLKGHGTSPWDLNERTRFEWAESVARARVIMEGITERTALVGFSAGGLLALRSAATDPAGLAGIVTVSAPIKLRDKAHMIVELVHYVNKLVGVVSHDRGIKPFHHGVPENPELNYRDIPIRALHELEHLIGEVEKMLPGVRCPALILQGDRDPRVAPQSAELIHAKIASKQKAMTTISSELHGVVYRNIGGCHRMVAEFLENLV